MDLVDNSSDDTDDDNNTRSDRNVNIALEDDDEDEMNEGDPFSELNCHGDTSLREMIAGTRSQTRVREYVDSTERYGVKGVYNSVYTIMEDFVSVTNSTRVIPLDYIW